MNNESMTVAGILLAFVVFGGILIFYLKNRKKKKRLPATPSNSFWDKPENRDKLKALAFIVVGLVFLNWLCAHIGWNWWNMVWWNHRGLFWVTQLAILFSFLAFIFTKNVFSVAFGVMVLVICISGWIWKAKENGSSKAPSGRIDVVDGILYALPGQWSDPIIRKEGIEFGLTRLSDREAEVVLEDSLSGKTYTEIIPYPPGNGVLPPNWKSVRFRSKTEKLRIRVLLPSV